LLITQPEQLLSVKRVQISRIAEGELELQIAKDLNSAGVTASITSFYQLAISDKRAIQISPEHTRYL
jgi:hypothetical protein